MDSGTIIHSLLLRSVGEVTVHILPQDEGRAMALTYGLPNNGCLVRVQSRCVYGEVFGSVHCDCRDQLDRAWQLILSEGAGVVMYLDQEGRGAGPIPKAIAYREEQENGVDTFRTYQDLGLACDLRQYDAAVRLLRVLRLSSIRLLTNNPEKLSALRTDGVNVVREPLPTPPHTRALSYIRAKKERGHYL